jgi:hypothetical protein
MGYRGQTTKKNIEADQPFALFSGLSPKIHLRFTYEYS